MEPDTNPLLEALAVILLEGTPDEQLSELEILIIKEDTSGLIEFFSNLYPHIRPHLVRALG